MSSHSGKARALVLTLLMIGSVFGGTIAFAGGAAALDNGNTTVVSGSSLNQSSSSTVTVGVNTTSSDTVTFNFSNLANNGFSLRSFGNSANATVATSYSSENNRYEVDPSGNGNFTIQFTADTTGVEGGSYNFGINNSSTDLDTTKSLSVVGVASPQLSAQPDTPDESAAYNASFTVAGGSITNDQLRVDVENADADSGSNVNVTVYDDSWSERTSQPEITDDATSNNYYRATFSDSFTFESGDHVVFTADNINNASSWNQTATISFPGSGDDIQYSFSTDGSPNVEDSRDKAVNATVFDPATGADKTTLGINFTSSTSLNPQDVTVTVDGETYEGKSASDSPDSDAGDNDLYVNATTVISADANVSVSFDGNESVNAFDLTADNQVAGATADRSNVPIGTSATVDVSLSKFDSAVNYTVTAPGSTEVTSGSTSSDSFSFLADFNQGGDYVINVSNDNKDAQAIVSATYQTSLNLTPSEPTLGDSVTVEGAVTDADGNGVANLEIGINDSDTDTDGPLATATTTSSGNFLTELTVNDAGTYRVTNNTSNTTLTTFTVDPKTVGVEVTSDGELTSSFNETLNVSVTEDDSDFPVQNDSAGNLAGYINVTGPFNASSIDSATVNNGSITLNESDTGAVDYIHVTTDEYGDFSVSNITVNQSADSVTATLENTVGDETYAGLEENSSAVTPASPDYNGSDSLSVAGASTLNVDTSGMDGLEVNETQSPTVSVTGSDAKPADGDGPNNLKNVSVSLTGPSVDLSATSNGSSSGDEDVSYADGFTFETLEFEQAGTATLDVTGYTNENESSTETQTFDVAGDTLANVTPETAEVSTNHDISVQVENAEDTQVNNRVVVLSGVDFTVNTSSGTETAEAIVIRGGAGTVEARETATLSGDDVTSLKDGSWTLNDDFIANDGTYTVENVSFANTGDVNVDAYTSFSTSKTTQTIDTQPITVQGVDVYNLTSDLPEDQFLAGQDTTVNFTVTKDGEVVNGSELNDLTLSATQNDTDVLSESSKENLSAEDGSANDAFQAQIEANQTASYPVNVSVSDGSGQTGSASFNVTVPTVEDDLAGSLTETVNTTVDFTVTDPRTSDVVDNGSLALTAVNTSFTYDGSTLNEGGKTKYVDLDENGTATINVTPADVPAATTSLDVGVDPDDGDKSDNFGVVSLTAGNLSVEAPDTLAPNQQQDVTLVLNDANGDAVGDRVVNLTGAGVDQSLTTDVDGVLPTPITPTTGTIAIEANNTSGGNDVTVDTISVRSLVDLSVSASDDSVFTDSSNVTFTVTRQDAPSVKPSAKLTAYNASDPVVQTANVTKGTATLTFDTAGDYTVVASKQPTADKAFDNASVNVSVQGYANASISADPQTNNTTSTHTVTLPVTADSAGDSFNTLEIDYSAGESATDVSEVGIDNIQSVMVSGDAVMVQDPSTSNNGHTLQLSFTGDTQLQQGDVVEIVYDDVQNPASAGDYAVTGSLNYQSDRVNAQSMTLTIETANATSIPAIGGSSSPPTDTDGDGKFEDVDGDGNATFNDAVALSFGTDTDTASEYPDAFDFDGDGDVDFDDAVELSFNV